MNFLNINRYIFLFFYIFVIIIIPSIDSRRIKISNKFPLKLQSVEYQQLAKYCYINDYPAWVQQQQEFMIWFDLAKLLQLPIYESIEFQQRLKQYHLQYECLRIVERLPILVGPG